MTSVVTFVGSQVLTISKVINEMLDFIARSVLSVFAPPYRLKEVLKQLYFVVNESVGIIVFSVCFAAVVTILEASFHMKMVIKNDSLVPGFASLLILRELGAVVSSLLLTSRVGAGLAAEVGSMKVTEQVDALKLLGIDPVQFLVVPRLIACVLGGWALSIIASVVCIFCAMLVSQVQLGYSSQAFVMAMNTFVGFQDLVFASIKGAVFGSIIPLVSCFYGFRCKAGAEGVGKATTNSVVTASILIIIADFLLSWLFSNFY